MGLLSSERSRPLFHLSRCCRFLFYDVVYDTVLWRVSRKSSKRSGRRRRRRRRRSSRRWRRRWGIMSIWCVSCSCLVMPRPSLIGKLPSFASPCCEYHLTLHRRAYSPPLYFNPYLSRTKRLSQPYPSPNQSQQAESIADKLQNLKKNEKERKEKIRKTKKEIERLQEMLDNPPEMESLDDIVADIVRSLLSHLFFLWLGVLPCCRPSLLSLPFLLFCNILVYGEADY